MVKVTTYSVSGANGDALMRQMDRKGPRHGFLARAIAQTRYSVKWDLDWAVKDDRCRLSSADVLLTVNYRYPELTGAPSPALKRRWARFMKGVRRHEEAHERIARQMVASAYKSLQGVSAGNDASCRKAKGEATRIVRAAYKEYEARQQRFDAIEHQPGGPVERLVNGLTR